MFVIVTLLVISYLVTKLDVKNPHLVIVGLAVLIVSPVVIGYVYSTYIMPVPEVIVPKVSYLTFDDAKKKLEGAGLSARIAENAYEKDVPAGMVISQKPDAGSRVKTGRIVNLKMSVGERVVNVPNLVGRDFSQIEVVLSEAGLRFGDKRIEISDQYQSGVVISQYPLPDKEVPLGTRVDVVIGGNPNSLPVKVPNIVSMNVDEAEDTLTSLKLNYIVFYQETTQFNDGTVLSQDPMEGEEIMTGDAVKIFIASHPTQEGK
jgi:beta-lactam-binding protein with PASTA domain